MDLTQSEELTWQKALSSTADSSNCVEVAALPGGGHAVRDSKDQAGPMLRFTRSEWDAFLDGVKGGEFD